jgi:hypothetical protein
LGVGPAIAAEDLFQYSCLNPGMGTTIRGLAKLSPRTLALTHGPSFSDESGAALRALADDYNRRISDRWLATNQVKPPESCRRSRRPNGDFPAEVSARSLPDGT